MGNTKLAPNISPNKSVEGAVANLAGCLVTATGLCLLFSLPLSVGVALGLSCGILGQAGDLLQSRLKRAASVKDSGQLLPGHGGVLDRLDSLLLSAPVSLFCVVLLENGMFHVKHWPW